MPSCKIILQVSWIAALSIKAEQFGPTVYYTFYIVRGSSCLSRLRRRWKGETEADVWLSESPISRDGGRARSRLQVSWISEDKLAPRDRKEAAWFEAVHRTSQGTKSQAQDAQRCISKSCTVGCVRAEDAKWFCRQIISIPANREVKSASAIRTASCEMKILKQKVINSTFSCKEAL